jgi:hypothetical protein
VILVAALACAALQVEAATLDGPSTLLSVDLPSGVTTTVATLDQRLNAFGYSAAQNVFYGISSSGRVIRVDRAGITSDVGQAPHSGLVQAVAGTIHGDYFYVRASGALYVLNINPASSGFLGLVQARVLWPIDLVLSVDDFDYNPADGLLYGVATRLLGHPEVVTIDPQSGHVHPLDNRVQLPDGPGYGAAVFGPDGALYASNNDEAGQTTLYRVALDGSGAVTRLAARGKARTIDSAGCLAALPPTVPPVPPGAPPGVPGVPGAPVVPTTTSAAVVPGTSATTTSVTTTVPTTVRPPSTGKRPPARTEEEAVALADRSTQTKRRWGLAVLLLVLGAGAVAAQTARRP